MKYFIMFFLFLTTFIYAQSPSVYCLFELSNISSQEYFQEEADMANIELPKQLIFYNNIFYKLPFAVDSPNNKVMFDFTFSDTYSVLDENFILKLVIIDNILYIYYLIDTTSLTKEQLQRASPFFKVDEPIIKVTYKQQ